MSKYKREDALDAFGHLTWTVGFCAEDEDDDRGDWIACFDFVVRRDESSIRVEYHVVVDSDTGGFTDTLEHQTVDAERAPFDIPLYWMGISRDGHGVAWTGEEVEAALETNERWNEALRDAIVNERARVVDAGSALT